MLKQIRQGKALPWWYNTKILFQKHKTQSLRLTLKLRATQIFTISQCSSNRKLLYCTLLFHPTRSSCQIVSQGTSRIENGSEYHGEGDLCVQVIVCSIFSLRRPMPCLHVRHYCSEASIFEIDIQYILWSPSLPKRSFRRRPATECVSQKKSHNFNRPF